MNRNLFNTLLITIIIVLVYSYMLVPLGIFNKPRLFSRDLINWCVYRLAPKPAKAKDIVIVSIDRESLRRMERHWPWTRDVFAELLLKLEDCNTNVVYVDFSFIGETEHDEALAEAMKSLGNVIIPLYFDEKGEALYPTQNLLVSAAGFGPVNKLRDEDLVVRDALLVYFSPTGGIIDYSVELITVCRYMGVTIGEISLDKRDLVIELKRGQETKVPLRPNGAFPINYMVRLNDLEVIPFWKIIKRDFSKETFQNKIVIVGLTDKALLDVYRTPLGDSSGIEVVANTILTLISKRFIKYRIDDINFPFILLLSLIISFSTFRMSLWKGFFLFLMEIGGYISLVFLMAWWGCYLEIFSAVFLGTVVYIITKIYRFVCLLKEQNIELQKALKDLKEAEADLIELEKLAAMGKISAQISHEIKNPLTAIKNSINTIIYIINHGLDMEKIREIKEIVDLELNRLTKLSADILSFSRPPKEEAMPVNVNEIAAEIRDRYGWQLEQKSIQLSLNLGDKIGYVMASSDKLSQVLLNMVFNAAEAMPSGGILSITTRLEARHYVEISVADTGAGIPEKIIKKIFDPFFTTKEESRGTGLGLFIVYNIIKGYGGSIDVKSQLGKGTTFIIKIPVIQ